MSVLLLIVALVLFVLRAFGVHTSNVDLGWLGLAFYAAFVLVEPLYPPRRTGAGP